MSGGGSREARAAKRGFEGDTRETVGSPSRTSGEFGALISQRIELHGLHREADPVTAGNCEQVGVPGFCHLTATSPLPFRVSTTPTTPEYPNEIADHHHRIHSCQWILSSPRIAVLPPELTRDQQSIDAPFQLFFHPSVRDQYSNVSASTSQNPGSRQLAESPLITTIINHPHVRPACKARC